MSSLKIEYAGLIIFEGEVDSFGWTDVSGQSVTVTGQLAKPKAASSGGLGAIADMIAQASKAKTAAKHRELSQAAEADTNSEIAEDAADD